MTPASEPAANKQNGATPSGAAPGNTSKPKYAPTAESLTKLLALFSSDRDEAGKQYEKLRTRLIRFFEWRGCSSADILADKTFDRVMKKIDEGAEITNPTAFICTVANYIFQEDNPGRLVELDEELTPVPIDPAQLELEDDDPLIDCFDKCLDELPPDNKSLIMNYYQEEKRTKIDLRRQLAEQLGIPMNALRIRAHRIRKSLEDCIQHCLAHSTTT